MDPSICAALSLYLLPLLLLLLLLEQISYLRKKGTLPGPALVFPFLGNVVSLVSNPTRFWDTQSDVAQTSPLGVSANYIIGKYMVFIRSADLSHKVFANVRPDAFHLMVHPFGKKLFSDQNLTYLFGREHKDLRRLLAPNFTTRALSLYVPIEHRVVAEHLARWLRLSNGTPISLRSLCREMSLDTSQTVFVGPYLSSGMKERFNVDFNLINVGAMKLPIDLPGFGFWKAKLAAKRLAETLGVCVEESKKKLKDGGEPTCVIDFLMQEILRATEVAMESGIPPPLHSSTADLGNHVLDFLVAAQDASTSSLLWAVVLLDSHQEVVAKVRREVSSIWSPESSTSITSDQLLEMKYTQAVAREVLRMRPPAMTIPHLAGKDFPLTETYTIPKGALVFPSVHESSFQGFVEPYRFDPDRFMDGRQEDQVFKKNFLVFGAGAHQCVGQRYATNYLVLFIVMFTSLMDFKRQRSDGCDDIIFVPSSSPKDDCKVSLKKRCA